MKAASRTRGRERLHWEEANMEEDRDLRRRPDEDLPARRAQVAAERGVDPDTVKEGWKQFQEDGKLLARYYEELALEHPHWWVGVYKGQFYLAPTYDEWVAKLEQ